MIFLSRLLSGDLAGLLAWFEAEHLPADVVINSGLKFQQVMVNNG